MTIKALSRDELKTKLGAMVEGRPWLAGLILNGQSSFSEGGQTYALRGSPALTRGEPELVTRDVVPRRATEPELDESETERSLRVYREEVAKEERAAKTSHNGLATRLGGAQKAPETTLSPSGPQKHGAALRIEQYQARERVRSVGVIPSKSAPALAARLEAAERGKSASAPGALAARLGRILGGAA